VSVLEQGLQVGVGVIQNVRLTFVCVLNVQGSCSRCYALGERERECMCASTKKRDWRESVSAGIQIKCSRCSTKSLDCYSFDAFQKK